MTKNKKLPRVKRMILEELIAEVEDTGVCPLAGRLTARVNEQRQEEMAHVNNHLKWLAELGYIHQPHPYGPWAPLKDTDGTPLRILLARGDQTLPPPLRGLCVAAVLKDPRKTQGPPPTHDPYAILTEGWDLPTEGPWS